ncbi:UDP-forming cellulose synthase catalytic subunit [Afifella sp. H1R]|uniref:UDP-forming cellulose synthase catalytic subunit n=1 Tax=Afifella sp. H1R TaxID=2908841 RepID=UPI001F1DC99B|nr:UDP-forming cellulose synthase catalytic subunit [Afifella sp. H1R]MCF1502288.1 UDP-forming cellulose synthase catalytic subunit [Afifella sp. H1R]
MSKTMPLAVLWLLATTATLLLIMQPISIEAQFVMGVAAVGGMAAVWMFSKEGVWRQVFLALATAVVLRYVYWRTTSTLPPISEPINFVPGFLVYLMEMFSVLMLFISLFITADPLERKRARQLRDAELPTVDIFIPTYNEDKSLLATTIAAALAMDYPHEKRQVWLLDDGGTEQKVNNPDPNVSVPAKRRRAELQRLCAQLGAHYLTRERNEHAKAGNLNNGLDCSTADLIVVFDADHGPVRSFLRETVGHFADDPRLFLVQTPHFFLNPDPLERNLSTFERMPSENEMFYSVIQKGLDKWNAAFFCGSAAVLRRAALEETGGFSGVSITEDCETALELHSRGWNSRYVDIPLIAGLQPENFVSFIGQRSRWCRGMVQILMLKNPLFKRGLRFEQRIAYLSSSLFWLFPLTRLTFMLAPLLYIIFSLQIYEASFREFVGYTVAYMAVNIMLQSYLYGRLRWPWVSELYEYVQSVYLGRAILSVVVNPRAPTFNVTAKGQTSDKEQLSALAGPYFAIFGVLAVTGAYAAWRYFTEPAGNDLLMICGVWNAINLVIAGVALGVVSEMPERRRAQRLAVVRRAVLEIVGVGEIAVSVEDVSTSGVRVRPLEDALPPMKAGATIAMLRLVNDDGTVTKEAIAVVLRRAGNDDRGRFLGMEFIQLTAPQYKLIADLLYRSANVFEAFRSRRRKSRSVIGATIGFLSWSFYYTLRAFRIGLRRNQPAATDMEGFASAETGFGVEIGRSEPALPRVQSHLHVAPAMPVEAGTTSVPAPAAAPAAQSTAAVGVATPQVEQAEPSEAQRRRSISTSTAATASLGHDVWEYAV